MKFNIKFKRRAKAKARFKVENAQKPKLKFGNKNKSLPLGGRCLFRFSRKRRMREKQKRAENSAPSVLVYRSYAFGNPDDFFGVNISLDPKHVFVFAPDNGTFSIF